MNTLGEDILALQKRLLEETGLKFAVSLLATEREQPIPVEQAIRVGEMIREVLGGPARVEEYLDTALMIIGTPGLSAGILCKELLSKRTTDA